VLGADAAYWRQALKSAKALSEMLLHMDHDNIGIARHSPARCADGRQLRLARAQRLPATQDHRMGGDLPQHPEDGRDGGPGLPAAHGRLRLGRLREQTYNIRFHCYDGIRGWVGQGETPIAPADPDSLEGLWSQTGQQKGFLDLRNDRTVRVAGRTAGHLASRQSLDALLAFGPSMASCSCTRWAASRRSAERSFKK